MSERHKPHNGRDRDGRFKVRQEDVEDKLADPQGPEYVEDDVKLAGAVEDTGPDAGFRGERIERLIEENRENVERIRDKPE
jgi:hypothetical protein